MCRGALDAHRAGSTDCEFIMTLGMAWVRTRGRTNELVVASDSRLSGGQFWDSNPKIILLPRSDCVMSFAGNTNDAYPLMLQAYNAISMYPRSINRTLDVIHLKGHIIRVLNYSRQFINHLPHGETLPMPPEARFMFSGYSWREKKFRI
jgi:20S proteasome alpha/beta subunit